MYKRQVDDQLGRLAGVAHGCPTRAVIPHLEPRPVKLRHRLDELDALSVGDAQEQKIATGSAMRVDTTVVETDIHFPTDSSLLGDGVRVLTRIMKKVAAVAGKAGTQLRDRSRSAKRKVLAIARASRNKTETGRQKMKKAYRQLLEITSRVVGQAKKFSCEIARRVKRGNLSALHKAKKQLDQMIPRVQQVMRQTRERVLRGNTRAEGKLLSIFETHTEVIRKGKAHKPNEFGKLVLIQEAENQIITHYQVCEQRPADATLLVGCLEEHVELFGRVPELVAADPGFFSAANESKAQQMGVRHISIPSHDTKSAARKQRQKQRWFKKLQKWRTGREGRISVLKRLHGLRRSLYKDRTACGAGSDSASSPIPSFISVPTWPGKHAHADPPLRSIHQIALPPAPKPFPLDIREAPALS